MTQLMHNKKSLRRSLRPVLYCALALLLSAMPCTASDTVTIYTALTTTTPQMPLWAAIRDGWPQGKKLVVEYWKNLDDLRGTMLAGRGQIWVGNLESFAQAALRGAPVTLAVVSGWKKFYFLAPMGETFSDMAALAAALREKKQDLAVTPQDGPSLSLLEETTRRGGPAFSVAAMAPQQLMLEMLRGTRQYALLPEPLVSLMLAKKPSLHVVLSLEEEFARLYGGKPRLPLVGVAVHTRFAEENPDLVRELVTAMTSAAPKLATDPAAAIAALPSEVLETLGPEVIAASLTRDTIEVVPAADIRAEIAAYLAMVMPKTNAATGPAGRLDALLNGPFLLKPLRPEQFEKAP